MGLVRYAQTTFTSGEFSPLMKGQTQLDRYYAATDKLRNMEPLPQGPADKRAGMQYLGTANLNSAGTTRLVEFVASEQDAMVIEIDTDNIRFWKNGAQIESGGSPYELTSFATTATVLEEMHYTQEGNSIYFFHNTFYPRRLRRIADDEWEVAQMPLVTEPYTEDYRNPGDTLTLSATTGTGVTATAGSGSFRAADVYRFIRAGAGYGVITGYTSTTVVTISVLADFSSTSIASGDWELYGGNFNSTLTFTTSGITPLYGTSSQVTASAATFRANDVGKFIAINNGVVRITGYTNNTTIDVVFVTNGDSLTATDNWVMYTNAWQASGDYPSTGCFHEGRLFLAGAADTSANKNRVFGSRPNDYTRFDIGPDDDDGLAATLGGRANQVRWIESARDLLIGTVGDERTLSGINGPLTPSSLTSAARTDWGSATVKPVLVNNEVIFVQRSRKTVRNSLFSFQDDTYTSDELSFFAEHLATRQVKEMALQEDPRTVVWMVMEDGTLCGMSYKRDQNVLGWGLHDSYYQSYQASIESVAVIPGVNGDEVWLAVRRRVGDSTYQKTIERLDSDSRYAYLDCWTKVTNSPASTTVSGLPSWMDGLTVSVIVDGATHPDRTVASGSITLDNEATTVYVGFPYTARLKMLEPEGGIGNGNSQGTAKRVARSMIRVYDTGAFEVNGQTIPTRDANMSMGQAPDRVTGDIKTDSGTAWDEQAGYEITSSLPLPLTVVMIAFHYEANVKL